MNPLESGLPWTAEDTSNFRTFLLTPTGQKLFPKAVEAVPRLLPEGETNKLLIRNGEVRGFQMAFITLQNLAYPPAKTQGHSTDNYPDLLNDALWEGEKLTPEVKSAPKPPPLPK